jgi:hypothetical protein
MNATFNSGLTGCLLTMKCSSLAAGSNIRMAISSFEAASAAMIISSGLLSIVWLQ